MDTDTAPNHHRDHPGFAGLSGLLAAATFSVGRGDDAALAIDLTSTTAGVRVVDIGCGPGVAARRAARLGATVTGVDPAPVMLRVARLSPRRGKVRFVTGTAEDLPLDDDAATVAWSLATVHHWGDIDAGLREVLRVLAPGGRFLALERLTHAGATGVASHGWTPEQAETFAARCLALGFADASVDTPTAHRPLISVVART
jgi:ubiquinone/menaquinone biosynthesis C-methylase UbiE